MVPWTRCLGVRANVGEAVAKAASSAGAARLQRRLQHASSARDDASCMRNVVKSPLPDIQVPNILIHDYLLSGIEKWHDKTAFECIETKRSLTYAEVNKKSDAFAGYLRSLDLQRGDVIAIVLVNVPEYFVALIGGWKAGVVVSPINPEYTASEIKKQLISCHAKLVVTLGGLHPTIREAADGVLRERPGSRRLPVVAINHAMSEASPSGCVKFDEVVAKDWPPPPSRTQPADPTDVCLLPFSSGTTGLPKGVQLTHRNLVANALQTAAPGLRLTTETHGSNQDVVPIMLPMFHMYGLSVIGIHLFARGVKFITLPKFTTDAFAQVLHQQSPSILYVVPPMILMLLNNPILKLEKLSRSVRALMSAAAPLGAADIKRFRERTQGAIHLLQLYGLTETSPVTHSQSGDIPNCIMGGGIGVAVPNTACKIVTPGEPNSPALGPNQPGELLIKGPQVMKGYLNNEQASKDTISPEGWMRTGDVAYYDDDGQFFVTDRLKELIKVKGFQVAPAELEEVLRDHPDVADAAVIGVPDERSGEAPKAFVVLRRDSRATVDDIHAYMAKKVVEYKQLRGGVALLDAIPKTASGKILRRNLKDL